MLFILPTQKQSKRTKTRQTLEKRIQRQQVVKQALKLGLLPEAPLMPFDGSSQSTNRQALPFTQQDYIDLVDTTGRLIRDDKRGFIPDDIPRLVAQLNIDPDQWIEHVRHFGRRYGHCAGQRDSLMDYARQNNQSWGTPKTLKKFAYPIRSTNKS